MFDEKKGCLDWINQMCGGAWTAEVGDMTSELPTCLFQLLEIVKEFGSVRLI
jgi:hypothetical protein